MALPDDLSIGVELWTVAPFTDDDTGIELWEPVQTKVHWTAIINGKLYINDCIATWFFTNKQDTYELCDHLNEESL